MQGRGEGHIEPGRTDTVEKLPGADLKTALGSRDAIPHTVASTAVGCLPKRELIICDSMQASTEPEANA